MKAIVLGSTGAVGTALTKELIAHPAITAVTLLVRRRHADPEISQSPRVTQHIVDVLHAESYESILAGHELAFSTFGVGEPSKISRDEFIRIDLTAVQAFAQQCKKLGIRHFSSLGAVGANPDSSLFYLKIKGQLEQSLISLTFPRLSLFRPSMIMTPENRYGLTQALSLRFYPYLDSLLVGRFNRYRSIKVGDLGRAMARNALKPQTAAVEILSWAEIAEVIRG